MSVPQINSLDYIIVKQINLKQINQSNQVKGPNMASGGWIAFLKNLQDH